MSAAGVAVDTSVHFDLLHPFPHAHCPIPSSASKEKVRCKGLVFSPPTRIRSSCVLPQASKPPEFIRWVQSIFPNRPSTVVIDYPENFGKQRQCEWTDQPPTSKAVQQLRYRFMKNCHEYNCVRNALIRGGTNLVVSSWSSLKHLCSRLGAYWWV
jgi:hypothetical protein